MESLVHKLYNKILDHIEKRWHNKTTTNQELEIVGKGLLGDSFKGVYAYDTIPKIENGEMLIFNLDTNDKPGSHWCALYKKDGSKYIYDSFGRKVIGGAKFVHSDVSDREQRIDETNCGQRCLAWLYMIKKIGIDKSILI